MVLEGMIDVQTCVQVLTTSYQENLLPLGIFMGILAIGFAVIFILFWKDNTEKNLQKDYLRRQGLLNKYEDWKKDRKLNSD